MKPNIPLYKKRCLSFCLAALLFCGLTGCSERETPASPEEHLYEYEDFKPVTEIKEGNRDIYLIFKSFQSQYWQQIIQGAVDAGNAMDCNIYLGGTYYETGHELQEMLLEEAASRGADAIILAPLDSTLEVDTVLEIHEAGIPIILVDTILNSDDYDVCFMTDNLQAGELAAKEMLRQLEASGVSRDAPAQIAIQVGSTGSQTIVDRLAGFSQYWSKYAPPSWVVLDDVKCNNGDIELATQFCREYLDTYPGLKGVLGCNNGSTAGFAQGILDSGRSDITIIGFDYSDQIAQLIFSRQCPAATIVQLQYNMGQFGVTYANHIIDGTVIEQKFIDTGVYVVNRENVSTPDIQKILTHQ